jgi:hypothetical protein
MFLAQAFNIVRETLERDRDTRPHGAASEALLEIEDTFRALLQENDRLRLRPPIDRRLRAALESIAKNTSCDRCQEAALVAKAALRETVLIRPTKRPIRRGTDQLSP